MSFKIVDKKRFALLILSVLAIIGLFIFFGMKLSQKERANESGKEVSKERIYEALVQPFDQNPDGSGENDPSSLQKGDVIVIFPEGHPWSESEKTSYLILKLKLIESDANKLVEPVRKEVEQSGDEKDRGPRSETVKARKYRIKIESLDYDLQKFWGNPVQPYPNQVFDSGMIEQKT
jgi:hypothetical protein